MKKIFIALLATLLLNGIYEKSSFAQNYAFPSSEFPFFLSHENIWNGMEEEHILFSLIDTSGPLWVDKTEAGYPGIPIVGDVIESVRVQGPGGLDMTTTEVNVPAPIYSIEGRYRTDPVRIEYQYRAYSYLEYELILQDEFCPHPAGNYILTVNCTNGQSLVGELPYIAAKDSSVLPPPENVALTLNNDGSVTGTWTNPITYPEGVNFRARIEVYKDGIYQKFRVRIRELPRDFTQITFEKELIDMLRIHGDEFRFRVQAIWYIEDSGVTNENYAHSQKINYIYENNKLVKKDYVPKKEVVVIPLQ